MLSPEPAPSASHKALRPAPSSLGKTAEEVSENETAFEEVRDPCGLLNHLLLRYALFYPMSGTLARFEKEVWSRSSEENVLCLPFTNLCVFSQAFPIAVPVDTAHGMKNGCIYIIEMDVSLLRFSCWYSGDRVSLIASSMWLN